MIVPPAVIHDKLYMINNVVINFFWFGLNISNSAKTIDAMLVSP